MPPAWYPDPVTPGLLRWWDGYQWTSSVSQPAYPVLNAGPTGTRYAGFWERVLAFIIDSFVVLVPLGAVALLVSADAIGDVLEELARTDGTTTPDTSELERLALAWNLVAVLAAAVYAIVLQGKYGRTLGMRVMSIRVVVGGGGVPGYDTAAKRWLIPGVGGLLGLIPVVGVLFSIGVLLDYLSMLWSDEKQCWHDKYAKTWVVHNSDPPRA